LTHGSLSVSREELYDGCDYSRPDSENSATKRVFEDAVKHHYTASTGSDASDDRVSDVVDPKESTPKDEEFDFRLFATSKPTRLAISHEDDEIGDGGIIGGGRSTEYYHWNRQIGVEKLREEYRIAAVDGNVIKAWSKKNCPGWTMPWRAVSIKSNGRAPPTLATIPDHGRRKKPGKKQRMILQKRAAEDIYQKQRDAEATKSREEAEREKKTRRNREKKVKRKMKGKAKKIENSTY
jgi:hypothetical protein